MSGPGALPEPEILGSPVAWALMEDDRVTATTHNIGMADWWVAVGDSVLPLYHSPAVWAAIDAAERQVQADAYEAGRRDERADVVTWLAAATAGAHRDAVESDGNRGQQAATALTHATAAIQAGEHR